jgi:putative NADPH-quinone reductase
MNFPAILKGWFARVEHVYFYGADVSTPEMRRAWLDQAYQLGKDFKD